MSDAGCICRGNWRAIVNATEPMIGRTFVNEQGEEYGLFGVVHGGDDYYYGLCRKGETRLLSCVVDIEQHGYTLKP